jgi:23S rRNA (cytosine1962-C5)-methyltransferase
VSRPAPQPVVRVSRKGEERILGGHPWVFGDDLRDVPSSLPPGCWCRVESRAGRFLGTATVNLSARLALRLLSRGEATPSDSFFLGRMAEADERRDRDGYGLLQARRLLFSEGDSLPGLVADLYGDVLSVQILTAGMEVAREAILSALVERYSPRLVFERSEGAGRKLEGLPERRGPLHGEGDPAGEVRLDGLSFRVDASAGPKTGLFLDQRENRLLAARHAAGRRVLDGFCSTGAFGLYALKGGAASVLAVDASAWAVDTARENAAANGCARRWEGRKGNLFDVLRALHEAGERFGMVVLDPPSFAKGREGKVGALRGYRDVNRFGAMLLEEGGILATASCTQRVGPAEWREAVRQGASDGGVLLERVEDGRQPADHPVLLNVPETEYLKFTLYRRRPLP